jgi:enoyl-CoA hydratase
MSDTATVIARVEGRAGRLTLNRPQAIHALATAMCAALTEALLAWRDDPAVEAVMIDHEGPRGFCAGGDVRAVARSDQVAVREFFLTEYRMNALLHAYPKPTVAVMDGITMGGGLGISWPCRYRVATERTVAAMPEGLIGLFPDVGMGWRLPRMPGKIGLWFAMTGARLGPADCLLTGLATDYAPSARLGELKAAFAERPAMVERALVKAAGDAGEPPVSLVQDDIDRLFDAPSVEAIVAGLAAEGTPWAEAQGAALAAASPTTLKVAFRQLAQAARLPALEPEMVVEYRLAARIGAGREFREGVRARLVDKDNAPRWDPADLAGVTEAQLDALFAPLPADQEWTPLI